MRPEDLRLTRHALEQMAAGASHSRRSPKPWKSPKPPILFCAETTA